MSRLPLSEDGQAASKKNFKSYPTGHLPAGFAEVLAEESRQHLFVAIDHTSKATFVKLPPRARRVVAADLLQRVLEKLPCRVQTVLADNGAPFTSALRQRLWGWSQMGLGVPGV